MIEVYALKVDKRVDKRYVDFSMQYISEDMKKSLSKYCKWQDAQRSLYAYELLWFILYRKRYLNKELSFIRNEYGKPFLAEFPDIHFNLSHSGSWVVCAVDNEEIGIDIEKIEPIDMEIAHRFFSRAEFDEIQNKITDQRPTCFYDIWTLKESYIKAWGKGLSIPLNSFTVSIKPDGVILLTTDNDFGECFFKQYDIDTCYRMSLCSMKNEYPKDVIVYDIDDFLQRIEAYRKEVQV